MALLKQASARMTLEEMDCILIVCRVFRVVFVLLTVCLRVAAGWFDGVEDDERQL